MDHFALESDDLYQAQFKGKLHRNFMGYTAQKTKVMIGLGMSSISDSFNAFAQNVKSVKEYQSLIQQGELPVFKGHIHSDEDVKRRQIILDFMCQSGSELTKINSLESFDYEYVEELLEDEILEIEDGKMMITEKGKPFLRNVCAAFDEYINASEILEKKFSMSI